MKKLFFGLIVSFGVALGGAGAASQPRVFAIIAVNTANPDLGPSGATNVRLIKRLLTDLGSKNVANLKVSTTYIIGRDFSCNSIRKAIGALANQHLTGQDVVFFYYSGHGYHYGASTTRTQFPTMACSDPQHAGAIPARDLAFEDEIAAITALKPRFVLGIADACNTYVPEGAESKGIPLLPPGSALRQLFAQYSGVLLFSGAKFMGTGDNTAWYYPPSDPRGGVFTIRWLGALNKEAIDAASARRFASWKNIETEAGKPIDYLGLPTTQHPLIEERALRQTR